MRGAQRTCWARRLSISAPVYPAPFSTSSVCSPSNGAGRVTTKGWPSTGAGQPTVVNGPAWGSTVSTMISRADSCGSPAGQV